jgi:predicted nucleic acid-binding protein
MHLFLDTNILLDIIEARPEFVENSTQVLARAEEINARIFIAWHGLATIYYLIRRGRTEADTIREIDQILNWAEIAPVDSNTAIRARSLVFPDFEDAMQSACAENCFADIIITRNTKDFALSRVPALSPFEFLQRHFHPFDTQKN